MILNVFTWKWIVKNALGKAHGKDLFLMESFEMFPADKTAEKWFKENRWSENLNNLHCPRSYGEKVSKVPVGKPMPC